MIEDIWSVDGGVVGLSAWQGVKDEHCGGFVLHFLSIIVALGDMRF